MTGVPPSTARPISRRAAVAVCGAVLLAVVGGAAFLGLTGTAAVAITHALSALAGGALIYALVGSPMRNPTVQPTVQPGAHPMAHPVVQADASARTLLDRLEQQAHEKQLTLERLDLATQTAGIGVWDTNLLTRKVSADANLERIFGTPEIDDRKLLDMIHEEDRRPVIGAINAALDDPHHAGVVSVRHRIVRPCGEIRHIQTHIRAFRDARGSPVRMLGVTWDVTDEMAHAEKLREQTRHVEMLLERLRVASLAAGVSRWEVDLSTGQFIWVENRMRFPELAEVPVEQYLERLAQLVHPEDLEEFHGVSRESIAAGRDSYSQRFRVLRPDGTVRYLQTYGHITRDETGRALRILGATSDITNEVQTNEMLQRQAEQERALIDRLNIATEAAGISSWEIDVAVRNFLWMENPIKGLHTGNDGTLLEEFVDRMHPEDRGLFAEQLRQAFRDKLDRISYHYRAYSTEGKLLHIQVHARLLADETGRVVRALGVSWDITKEIEAAERLQRQAQQLREAERRLERASLLSCEGHWEADLVAKRLWFSASYHTLLGYGNDELPREHDAFRLLVHPDDFAAGRAALRKHLIDGAPFMVDQRLKTKSGEYRWFRQRGAAERDAQGRAVIVSGSMHDIHEHKLAEDALKLARRRFERAIHGTQDGLWELEADGTAWCSPRLAELLGYGPEEFPSDTNFLRTCLHPDDQTAVAVGTQAHFQQGQPYDVEVRLRTKSGEYLWYRARAAAERDASGRPLRLSGSLQDVTEARAAREELLRATQAAEAASRAKSEFLANVSHEIRTPMNGIIGMTGLLLDTRLDRTQRDFAETIRSSADSLLVVINDILDFSKIEAGKLDIEAIELDLRGSVEDVGGMMAFQAAAKNLELVVHVHNDVPDRVIGDPQRIRQCLVNLVGNAVKFTKAGEIVIEVRVTGRRDGKVVTHFEVRDSGIGIPPDKLDQLFQPFVQADSSTTRHFGGTGLGLSIVRRLVDIMGGRLGVESEIGKGSTFWFELPLEPAAHTAPPPAPETGAGRRVLIVDDNATNRRVLGRQLVHAGYDVGFAESGIEALALLEQAAAAQRPFEAVLADYRMPDMDGAALGERINADARLSQARVVLLTSLDRQGDIQRFASLGFAGYLTKPVRARELLDCMKRVLACNSSEWHMRSQPIVTRGTLVGNAAGRRYSGRVLLVEDNPVNQKVAVRFLERLGCTVRVADNGAEGVKAYREGTFDMVLMDLQMPVMDGLTATRAIRELEADGAKTPIVALTANAMAGQLEHCLAAGMDGFLTKPLQIARLHETLERHGLAQGARESGETAEPVKRSVPVDLARLNSLTEGDPQFAQELAGTFILSGEQVLEEIDAALVAFDRTALSRAAHKLKGASANIYAEPLHRLAESLESQAAAVDQPRLKELAGEVAREFTRAADFLRNTAPAPTAKAG